MRWSQRLLVAFFVGSGVNHFVMPRTYEQIMPPRMQDDATLLVQLSGVAEVVGGLAVLSRRTRGPAGLWLIGVLVGVFPANVYMAQAHERFHRIPRWALYGRLPLQPLMMWWAWRATRR